MKTQMDLRGLANELMRREETKRDLVADTRHMVFGNTGTELALVGEGSQMESFDLNAVAHNQIAGRVGIPQRYYDRMREEAPQLLAQNVNHWFAEQPERRMIRTLDGTARAFLSDRYRRIDNEDIAKVVLPQLLEMPAVEFKSCAVTDKRMYLKVVFPRLEGEVKRGDVVQAGIVISNSEVGHGSFSVDPLLYRLVCTNGMVVPESGAKRFGLRKFHVGSRVEAEDGSFDVFSDETRAADDQALMLKVRDILRAVSSQDYLEALLAPMREAAQSQPVERPARAVEELAKRVDIRQSEREALLEHLIRDGDYSRWGMANAVTRLANDAEDYERASELEILGSQVINLANQDWERVAVAS